MPKKRIYLDTSVISYLRQEDAPEKMAETLEFWEILKTGKYEVYISDVTIFELSKCLEPRRAELLALLSKIDYNEIETKDHADITELSIAIAKQKLLPERSVNDRLHIAAAILSGCNILVSWNFKHLVNVKTIDGVRMISIANNLNPVDIYSPTMLFERSDTDGEADNQPEL
ncbi:MAG: PIN domain-containing protein [Oscillospiraceae bacterium]|jgi:predicted nucleic acid-binding protein|nr:PIN domain-containing protein [Oscillospiraceae bacterium]